MHIVIIHVVVSISLFCKTPSVRGIPFRSHESLMAFLLMSHVPSVIVKNPPSSAQPFLHHFTSRSRKNQLQAAGP